MFMEYSISKPNHCFAKLVLPSLCQCMSMSMQLVSLILESYSKKKPSIMLFCFCYVCITLIRYCIYLAHFPQHFIKLHQDQKSILPFLLKIASRALRLCLDQGFGAGKGNGDGKRRWSNGPERLDRLTFSFPFPFPFPSLNPGSNYNLSGICNA